MVRIVRPADLVKVLRGAAPVQGVLEEIPKVEVPFHWGRGGLDQGVKVGGDLWLEALDNQEAGAPCVREEASCDLAEGVHRNHQETADQDRGEDSSCSETAGGSSYYVVEVAPFVQVEDSSCFEVGVGHRVQAVDSPCFEVEILDLVGCSYYGEELVLG